MEKLSSIVHSEIWSYAHAYPIGQSIEVKLEY